MQNAFCPNSPCKRSSKSSKDYLFPVWPYIKLCAYKIKSVNEFQKLIDTRAQQNNNELTSAFALYTRTLPLTYLSDNNWNRNNPFPKVNTFLVNASSTTELQRSSNSSFFWLTKWTISTSFFNAWLSVSLNRGTE